MEIDSQPTTSREIYSISELNSEARVLLEKRFPLIWVEGEISNLARPASGHIYFSLKDEAAQVRCAMFKMHNRLVNFQPKNGQQVLARVRISLYEARGEFQLIVEHMEETGDGALRRQFELLKQKLFEEGLFDEAHKQALPFLPTQLGVITSPSGAAIRDILSVLKRRFPGIPVLIYPVPVQGTEAPQAIVESIHSAAKCQDCDLLILARGGGSLEDLWAFNEETVARAINACPIPIVTGIGHEIDFTIADFVADYRAPTPSAAAEFISPDHTEPGRVTSSRKPKHLPG
jgi:exodeoxyribonuclease VII large subunit